MNRQHLINLIIALLMISTCTASFAHHAPQCRYTFTAPKAADLAKKYPELKDYHYVTYVVGGGHLYATSPLSIAKEDSESVAADCAPYLLYATFTKKSTQLSAYHTFRCPTYG